MMGTPDPVGRREAVPGMWGHDATHRHGVRAMRPNYQPYAVRVTVEFPLGQDELMQSPLEQGISTRRGIMNAYQESSHRDHSQGGAPHFEAARDVVIFLPLFAEMSDEAVDLEVDARFS